MEGMKLIELNNFKIKINTNFYLIKIRIII